jgi:hypothetical protein
MYLEALKAFTDISINFICTYIKQSLSTRITYGIVFLELVVGNFSPLINFTKAEYLTATRPQMKNYHKKKNKKRKKKKKAGGWSLQTNFMFVNS